MEEFQIHCPSSLDFQQPTPLHHKEARGNIPYLGPRDVTLSGAVGGCGWVRRHLLENFICSVSFVCVCVLSTYLIILKKLVDQSKTYVCIPDAIVCDI